MNQEVKMNLCFGIQFDNTLYIDHDLLGCQKEIIVNSKNAFLEFPREPLKNTIALLPPLSASSVITNHLPDKNWGVKNDGYSGSCIEACLVVFKTKTNLDFDLAKEQIGGEDVRTLLNEVMNWFESFNH